MTILFDCTVKVICAAILVLLFGFASKMGTLTGTLIISVLFGAPYAAAIYLPSRWKLQSSGIALGTAIAAIPLLLWTFILFAFTGGEGFEWIKPMLYANGVLLIASLTSLLWQYRELNKPEILKTTALFFIYPCVAFAFLAALTRR
jgi:hypothetical protein